MADTGEVQMKANFQTGMLEVSVRAPMSIAPQVAHIPMLDALEFFGAMTKDLCAVQRAAQHAHGILKA